MTTSETLEVDVRDAHLSTAQRELLGCAERQAREVLAPLVASDPTPGRVNRRIVSELADLGFLGRLFRREETGWRSDISALDVCLIREGLARACTEAETAFAMQGLGSFPLLRFGVRELVDEWIPLVASGKVVTAFALSEPQAGTDVAALSLRATQEGDAWRLDGEKTWISNAPDADLYTVFARSSEEPGARGLTAFLVPGNAAGLTGEPIELLSPHPIGRLMCDGVRIEARYVLGTVDQGFSVAMQTLDMFRPSVGAFAIGMASAAIDAAVAFTAQRRAFGGLLNDRQAIAHRLADIATRVQAARLLVHAAAAAYDAGVRPTTEAAAMAKLMATEVAQEAVDAAVQFHGARALERGHLLEHLYREVRAPRIYEGASEIQREIIARGLYSRVQDGSAT
jgi:acyl-CoA dehydrogenase